MNGNTRPAFAFSLNWKITLACLVFFPILISLGYWQLQRATEKQTILDLWYTQQAMPAQQINKLAELADSNTPLNISGQFDQARYWLFENRFFESKPGYDILMVFHTVGGEQILVNRGWVPASPYREELPKFATPGESVAIQGVLKAPTDFNMLQEKGKLFDAWPKRVLEINLEHMSKLYGLKLYPKVLQLEPGSAAALSVKNELPINMTPAKHRAYAFQWFSLAFALVVLWLIANSNIVQVLKKS